MKDFFNGNEYARLKLTEELLQKGILDIIVNKQPRQISISCLDGGQQMEPLVLPVLEFPWPTVGQLDSHEKVKSLSLEQKTHVKGFLILTLGPHWSQIYINGKGNGKGKNNNQRQEEESLGVGVNPAEHVINTIKKTVKAEDVLIRQVFYTCISAYTFDPLNLGILAPTSEGKTYAATNVTKYFPDVWSVGGMSTKVLIRQKGTLVNGNHEPIEDKVIELKAQISECSSSKENRKRRQDLIEELKYLTESSKRLIDLSGITLLFLEPPQVDLWSILKPILSHDMPQIEYPYVDNNERDGITTRYVVVRGWPACIFCSARDESKWNVWPEIQSRFLITSPNMEQKKYREANVLIAQKKGLPNAIQQQVIVSDKDVQLAKKCILYLKKRVRELYKSNNADYEHNTNAVWIPFYEILGNALQSNKGTDNRVANRLFSLLNIIPLARIDTRDTLVYGSEKLLIATLGDLSEVLYLMQNVTGIPSHKIKFFKEVFVPLYDSKDKPDSKDEGIENRIAVTTAQLAEKFKQVYGKSITTASIQNTYLEELMNNAFVDREDSQIDKRQKIYYPIVDIPKEVKIKKLFISSGVNNFFQCSSIRPPEDFKNIQENWLQLQISALQNYLLPNDNNTIQIMDSKSKEIGIDKFIESYEKDVSLSRYFLEAKNANSLNNSKQDTLNKNE